MAINRHHSDFPPHVLAVVTRLRCQFRQLLASKRAASSVRSGNDVRSQIYIAFVRKFLIGIPEGQGRLKERVKTSTMKHLTC